MNLLDGLSRLRRASEVEGGLEERFEGVEYTIPIFDQDAEMEIRERPNYGEILDAAYRNPEAAEFDIEHDTVTYTITQVSFEEWDGAKYTLGRIRGTQDLRGRVTFDLDFGDEPLEFTQIHDPKLFDDVLYSVDFYRGGTEMTVHHQYEDMETIEEMFFQLNSVMALEFSLPETIEELREGAIKWEVYNKMHS